MLMDRPLPLTAPGAERALTTDTGYGLKGAPLMRSAADLEVQLGTLQLQTHNPEFTATTGTRNKQQDIKLIVDGRGDNMNCLDAVHAEQRRGGKSYLLIISLKRTLSAVDSTCRCLVPLCNQCFLTSLKIDTIHVRRVMTA